MELGSYFLFLQEQIKDIIIEPAAAAADTGRQAAAAREAASDALWGRSWVWCPHSRAPTADFAPCRGSVSKAAWLNVSTRAQACAASIPRTSASSARVNFCLLNARTTRLCEKMAVWRREAQHIV
jgi:hypothetical protein